MSEPDRHDVPTDRASDRVPLGSRHYRRLLSHYYRLLVRPDARVLEVGCGAGSLLASLPNRDITGVDPCATAIEKARTWVSHGSFHVGRIESLSLEGPFDVIILSDTLNVVEDVQAVLKACRGLTGPHTRLVLNCHNTLWRPIRSLAARLGLAETTAEMNWLSSSDLRNLLWLSDWEVLRQDSKILLPLEIPFLSALLNRGLAPLLPWLCLTILQVARPKPTGPPGLRPSVSILVPARNEAGNIPHVLPRTPRMGPWMEFIFVEGHSRDETWKAIQEIASDDPCVRIKRLQQSGRGKGNAVREGFDVAEGDILMILDADLTMPPEQLPKFYEAVASGKADFANGCRLVYPMDDEAMRFLNFCANKLFAVAFSWVLGQPVKDTLCGTKVIRRSEYQRIARHRAYFGNFDPFGDFDLLFGADRLHLKIADIPIRYRDRSYGKTQISRFRHGMLLFTMLGFAARKLKFV